MMQTSNPVILGATSVLIGLPIIILHNIWGSPWEIVVTLLGWSAIFKGFLKMLNNSSLNKIAEKRALNFSKNAARFALIIIIIGCVLIYGAYSLT